VPYDVSFTATGDNDLDGALKEASQLDSLQDREPDSEATLRSRAAADRDRLNRVARAYGYYDASVDIRIDTKTHPAKVTASVVPGPQYTLDQVFITGRNGVPLPPDAPSLDPAELALPAGAPALAVPRCRRQ